MPKIISSSVTISVLKPGAGLARYVPRSVRNNHGPGRGSGNPFGGKHLRLIYSNKWNHVDGSPGKGGYVWQFGGDFGGGAPMSQRPGYPISDTWGNDSARKDMWRAPVIEVDGTVQVEMACNYVAYYPYPGPLDPAQTHLGPPGPDGICVICDKRGDFWLGPGYSRFPMKSDPPVVGPTFGGSFPVMRFRLPTESNGVRLGNGWYQPPQNLLIPSSIDKINPDDIYIGSGTGNFSGVSNNWATYDDKSDEMLIMARGTNAAVRLYRFPCLATQGRHVWTQIQIPRNTSKWYDFLNSQLREGAPAFSNSSSPSNYHGSQVVIGDYLYVTAMVYGGHRGRRIAYLAKYNLRNLEEEAEYISIPVPWVRNWDAPTADGTISTVQGSIPEFRDIQRMGHLIVLSPAYEDALASDPWLCWYDTMTGEWTLGQSYEEMRLRNPDLPAFGFNLNKGCFCTVEETGEAWVNLSGSTVNNGVIKYRVI